MAGQEEAGEERSRKRGAEREEGKDPPAITLAAEALEVEELQLAVAVGLGGVQQRVITRFEGRC